MQYVASYTCFAPADDPEFVILVMADEPNKNINYYGSVVAAPYARNIMQDALDHLGYYPEYTAEQYAKLDVPIPRLIDADVEIAQKTIEEDLHLECEIVGEGKTVVGQSPMTSTTVSRSELCHRRCLRGPHGRARRAAVRRAGHGGRGRHGRQADVPCQ